MINILKYLSIRFNSINTNGKKIEVFQNQKLIWGMNIENPELKEEIEYRNIVFDDIFGEPSIKCDFDFYTEISEKKVTTPMQEEYDKKHKVRTNGPLLYSFNGNQFNPKKILITFPGFMLSTSDIQYPLTLFNSIVADEVISKNFLIVAFQDRYFSSGSYMLHDEFGNCIKPFVEEFIISLQKKYDISKESLVFFGASKGGSIAINMAEKFNESTLIVSVPQMDIEKYISLNTVLTLPSENVYKDTVFPPIMKMYQKYNDENRKVYHYYGREDSFSNQLFTSKITFSRNTTLIPTLKEHGKVTAENIPHIKNLLISLSPPLECNIIVNRFRVNGDEINVQFANITPRGANFLYILCIKNINTAILEFPLITENISRKHLIKFQDNYSIKYDVDVNLKSELYIKVYENNILVCTQDITDPIREFMSVFYK